MLSVHRTATAKPSQRLFLTAALAAAALALTTVDQAGDGFTEGALATLVSVAPVMLNFMFSQRFLVSGLTAGGTKE